MIQCFAVMGKDIQLQHVLLLSQTEVQCCFTRGSFSHQCCYCASALNASREETDAEEHANSTQTDNRIG